RGRPDRGGGDGESPRGDHRGGPPAASGRVRRQPLEAFMSAYARSYAQAFLGASPAGYDVDRFLEAGGVLSLAMARDSRLKAVFASPALPAPAQKKALAALSPEGGGGD